MYGLVEVNVEVIRKAYRFLQSDDSISELSSDKKPFQNVKQALSDKKCIFTKEQLVVLSEILSEIVYASHISTSNHMLIKIEIAGIIQDIIEFYEVTEQVA